MAHRAFGSSRCLRRESVSGGAGGSVVGTSPKRNSRLLTEAYSRSAPSLHGHYPLPRYYGLSDSREKNRGDPRFLGLSFLTRRPQPPRRARWLHSPATSPSMSGFIRFDRLAAPIRITRPNQVCFRCGSRVCLARLRDADYSNSTRLLGYLDERVIPRVSSFQLTR